MNCFLIYKIKYKNKIILKKYQNFLKLNETPDSMQLLGLSLGAYQIGALAFNLIENEIKMTHYTHDEIDGRDIDYYSGRLWLEEKFISFWFYPNKEIFNIILNKIEKCIKNKTMLLDQIKKFIIDYKLCFYNLSDENKNIFKDYLNTLIPEYNVLNNLIAKLSDLNGRNFESLYDLRRTWYLIYDFKGFDNSWKVEVLEKDLILKDDNPTSVNIYDYTGQYLEINKKESQSPHLMNYKDKKKILRKSKKSKWKKYLKPFESVSFNKEIDDERITFSFENGSVTITETTPYYEFLDDISEEEFDKLGIDSDDFIYKIEHIEVKDSVKGKGSGKKLMIQALREIKKSNIKFIYLNASPMGFSGLNLNDLTNFYKYFGFKVFKKQGGNNLMYLKLI